MTKQPDGLISVLLNRTARIDERDDAAMDLGQFDEALPALVTAAVEPGQDEMVVASCGESIGEIWKRTGQFDRNVFQRLPAAAQSEIRALLGPPEVQKKPDA